LKFKFIIFFLLFAYSYASIGFIEFRGLSFIPKERAIDIFGIKQGDSFDEDKINQGIKDLYNSKYFKKISIKYDNNKLIINVLEHGIIGSISFRGKFENKTNQEISSLIQLKKGDIYSYVKLKKAKSLILKKLKKDNLIGSQVELIEKNNGNYIDLVFDVKEGNNIYIHNIFINGNKNISTKSIKSELMLKGKDPYFSSIPFFSDGKLNFDKMKFNKLKLKDYYLGLGYLDFDIDKHLLIVDKNNFSADLYININEGIQYIVNDSNVSFNPKSISSQFNFQSSLQSFKGEIYDISIFRKNMKTINDVLRNKGYAKAIINPEFKKQANKMNIIYHITPNKIYHINDVIIKGNKRTQDIVIRRNLYIYPKSQYSLSDIEDSKTSLLRLGYFEKVNIREEFISNNKINLHIEVEETRTASWNIGGGYSSSDGLFIDFSIAERNLFGSGLSNKIKITKSKAKEEYIYDLTNPRVFNTKYSVGFQGYKRDQRQRIYNKASTGLKINIGKKLSKNMDMSFSGGIDNSLIYENNNSETNELQDKNETFSEHNIVFSLKYNSTDNFFFPKKGMTYSLYMKLSGSALGGDVNIFDIRNYFTYHKGLEPYIGIDSIFNFKAKLHNIISLDDTQIPLHKKIFLGGTKSVRGFEHNSIYPSNNEKIGGLNSFVISGEISTPIPGQKMIRIVLFTDYGMIGVSDINDIQKASYGIAIQLNTGSIPISLSWAKPILNEDKSVGKEDLFEFMIGNSF